MAREFVTRSRRFYCVSLQPDICKTPMGNSTPPIPYTIKGEFAEATGVSPNIRSGGDPLVIDASTMIPSVTGDAPGSANGIKSGTVGKRVQHDDKSKTVRFNGERAIREGDTVWMNDKNTSGKIYERGGEAARPRIGAAPAQTEKKSFGDKFDDAMSAAADKVNAGKEWVGGKVHDFAQTRVGGKVMDGLAWVSEKTELTAVKQWKEGLARGVDNAVEGGGRGMMAAGALTTAALEMVPTSLLDLIPGGGKGAGAAGKVASTAGKLEHAAADAAKLGVKAEEAAGAAGKVEHAADAAQKAENAGHATADAAKGEELAAEAGGAGKPPNGNDGGKSKKNNSGEKGKCGEWLAKMDMVRDGFDQVVAVQNNSGHGVDLIGRNSATGEVKVWEVKTSEGASAPGLSRPQREMGGEKFTAERLRRAANGEGNYGKVPAAKKNARTAREWIAEAGEKISYEKREVFVDDLEKGCAKHPNRPSRSKPWEARK